jgi:threonine/homoserine/homoserine lactone efflux protein
MLQTVFAIAVIFGTSFVIALSGALMPGPLLTVTITESVRRGPLTGPLMILGHGVLELVMVAILLLGLGPWLKHDLSVGIVGTLGAVLLLWMAVGLFRSIPSLTITARPGEPVSKRHPVTFGVLMSLANPYWTLWWVTIGLGYITYSITYGVPGLLAFFCGHILADLAWYSAVSWSFSRGKRFLNNTAYRSIMAVCGGALAFFALVFARTGILALRSLIT